MKKIRKGLPQSMKIKQYEITISPKKRGFHLITNEIIDQIRDISNASVGTLCLFLKHSSASICINENADPDVRIDLENFYSELCDKKPYFTHVNEGEDDMPGHIKSTLIGINLNIPVTNGALNMGTWQGIYLNEHRNNAGSRNLVATLTYEPKD